MKVNVYESRAAMGAAAATAVAAKIGELLMRKDAVNMVFAAAPSQEEFLSALVRLPVEWERVRAFHMDEYIGLAPDAPQGFGNFLRARLFSLVSFKQVFYMPDDYAALLEEYPTDIVCLGIGENTHLAFNDPHVARFDDPAMVKIVDLDMDCRQQQVNDGCFASLDVVPTHALTMTIPALMRAGSAFVIVPGARKAAAVGRTLYEEVDPRYPSTILRRHPDARMFLDRDSSISLEK